MASKHTPGPWEVEPHSDADECVNIVSDYRDLGNGQSQARWIAECNSDADSDMTEDEYAIALDTMNANARLIAAAPELYDLLISYTDPWSNEQTAARARALLARIDGGE